MKTLQSLGINRKDLAKKFMAVLRLGEKRHLLETKERYAKMGDTPFFGQEQKDSLDAKLSKVEGEINTSLGETRNKWTTAMCYTMYIMIGGVDASAQTCTASDDCGNSATVRSNVYCYDDSDDSDNSDGGGDVRDSDDADGAGDDGDGNGNGVCDGDSGVRVSL